MGLFSALFGAPRHLPTIDRDIRWKVRSALQPVADEIKRLKVERARECARKDQCMKDAMDILSRIKRGQNTKHVLQLRDDAVAFLKIGAGEEGEVE